jgi:hypothetical protein
MKFITLLFLTVIITITANSQITKGGFLIGGNIGFSSTKFKRPDISNAITNNFFISPGIGYFIIDKLAAGIRLNFTSSHEKAGTIDQSYTNTTLSPFARYYFLPVNKMVNAFINLSYNNSRTKFSNQSTPSTILKRYEYTIAAGPSIFLNQQIALEFTAGYQWSSAKGRSNSKETQFNTGLGLQIHLGKIKTKAST